MALIGCTVGLVVAAWFVHVSRKPVEPLPSSTIGKDIPVFDYTVVAHPLRPKTLTELLALSPAQIEKVDIARINLLCAVGLHGAENLNVEEGLKTLDAWTTHIAKETVRNFHHFVERPEECNHSLAYYRMGMIGTVLVQDMEVQYNPKWENEQRNNPDGFRSLPQRDSFYSDARDVFLHGLLSGRHQGTCSSMPFLYVAIGRRLGYPVHVAARKNHLYARYENEDGTHLNVESTENRGFSTPTDDDYRAKDGPLTDEDIRKYDWLRPLSNKDAFGICLCIRALCLRSAKRYDESIAAWDQAERYFPDTSAMRSVVEKNKNLARAMQAEDRCNAWWREIETLQIPATGPKHAYFRDRKNNVFLMTSQSTNYDETETIVYGLLKELKDYWAKRSDFPMQTEEGSPPASATQKPRFLTAPLDAVRVVRLPEKAVPSEYRQSIPADLMNRLRKLRTTEEIAIEMQLYASEDMDIRQLQALETSNSPHAVTLDSIYANRRARDLVEPLMGPPLRIEIVRQ